jgi:methylenetetrahydrofolate dehydrogenase (NADP+) / methenyltetrahydrofolate cyclohydrolase
VSENQQQDNLVDRRWGNAVQGSTIKRFVQDKLQPYSEALRGKKVQIILSDIPADEKSALKRAKYESAVISARQKVKSFESIGCEVQVQILNPGTTRKEFRDIITASNRNLEIEQIIVQYPLPVGLEEMELDIAPEKNLDSLGDDALLPTPENPAPATSEGIARVVDAFADIPRTTETNGNTEAIAQNEAAQSEAIVRMVSNFAQAESDVTVAVVGAKGFVGQGVVRLLEEQGINVFQIDASDADFGGGAKLMQVRDADIVISATGVPNTLDARHITPFHRLVVDSGFTPIIGETVGSKKVEGDIDEEVKAIAQNMTPVPGGIGPTEMAVLMQRLVKSTVDPNVEDWSLQDIEGLSTDYLTREEVAEIQRDWAQGVYATAHSLFESRADSVSQEDGFKVLEIDGYTLSLAERNQELSIRAQGIRAGEDLLKYDQTVNITTISPVFNVRDNEAFTQMQSEVEPLQRQWAADIYSVARNLFDTVKSFQPERIEQTAPGVELLSGRNYALQVDSNQNIFTLLEANRGAIAKYNLSRQTVDASRLIATDAHQWMPDKNIAVQFTQPQGDRQLEP